MIAELTESIGKKTKWLSISFKNTHRSEIIDHHKFEGEEAYDNFIAYLNSNKKTIDKIDTLNLYFRYQPFEYLLQFSQLKSLHIKGTPVLSFPKLNSLKKLKSITINQFGKPTKLTNLSTAKNLEELTVGDFTFNGPIIIENFDEILKCKKLKKLILSYSKFDEEELKKIVSIKTLREFGVHQKIETDTLAYLHVNMPKVKSKEFSAWQGCNRPWGDVKINGKRKPYLFKNKDADKISKYESKFEDLKQKYLSS